MGIDIAASTFVSFLLCLSCLIIGANLGSGFKIKEFRKERRHLHLELETCYHEADQLRAIIYDLEAGRSQSSTPSRWLNSVK